MYIYGVYRFKTSKIIAQIIFTLVFLTNSTKSLLFLPNSIYYYLDYLLSLLIPLLFFNIFDIHENL